MAKSYDNDGSLDYALYVNNEPVNRFDTILEAKQALTRLTPRRRDEVDLRHVAGSRRVLRRRACPMRPDPRGRCVTVTEVLPMREATSPRVYGTVTPVRLSCGHVVELNPVFAHRAGDRCYCLPCGETPRQIETLDVRK